MKVYVKAILFLFIFANAAYVLAGNNEADDIAEFKNAYARYKELSAAHKWHESLPYSKIAYEIGMKFSSENHKTVSMLAYNHAFNLARVYQYHEAYPVMMESMEHAKKAYGEEALELIQIYLDLGKIAASIINNDEYEKYFEKALSTAEKIYGKDTVEAAKIGLSIAESNIVNQGYELKKRYSEYSYKIFKDKLGDSHKHTADALYNLGVLYFSNGNNESAEKYFLEALNIIDNPDSPDTEKEMLTRYYLVQIYEYRGESGKAEHHLIAIERFKPENSTQEYIPIYKYMPTYPVKAIRTGKEGYVVVEFDIDEKGFVVNPRVIEKNHSVFVKPALEAVKKCRYLPGFVDGKPVVSKSVRNIIVFQKYRLESTGSNQHKLFK
jgi:TonB family protein